MVLRRTGRAGCELLINKIPERSSSSQGFCIFAAWSGATPKYISAIIEQVISTAWK
jgi:hypothetical protein